MLQNSNIYLNTIMINSNDQDKFLDYFSGRADYFAVQNISGYTPVKTVLNSYYLEKHLMGFITCGIYVLTFDSKCNFICIDLDIPKNELDQINFKNSDSKYSYLENKLKNLSELFLVKFNLSESNLLFEDTGGRGYHIWLFFQDLIDGVEAVKFSYILKEFLDFDFEFFPKQSKVDSDRRFGNLIKLPLGLHRKFDKESKFFKVIDGKPTFFEKLEESINHLKTIDKISREKFSEIIANNISFVDLSLIDTKVEVPELSTLGRTIYKKDLNFLFNNCKALDLINKKAIEGKSLNYKEAFHFTNVLLSVEDTEQFIVTTMEKSYKTNFSSRKTTREIENIKLLHPTSCKRLIYHNICSNYCNKKIEAIDNDALLRNCNPLLVNLKHCTKKEFKDYDDIVEAISNIENLRNTYWKLKKYHENDDTLFYDKFDFEYFEKNLELNLLHISKLIKNNYEYPLIGFWKIGIPKSINENNLEYRYLSYSSIFDLILIQSIFNIISSQIEKDFQDSSYGYRVNLDRNNVDEIFLDWREYYPKFRHEIIKKLRDPDNKYYICCDIKKYYDVIVHSILIEKIKPYVRNDSIFNLLKLIIESYDYDSEKKTGIPQSPAYSRVLANLYLNDFDIKISKLANSYFRYVDDFFIFFNSKENAEKVFSEIVAMLNDLGLSLSESEDKKPEILETINETPILKKIDNLKYGIFEEYKYIEYYNPKQIEKFYDAIRRKEMSILCKEEILKINEQLPSIIYLISNNIEIDHDIYHQLLSIIEYLVNNSCFYPKRLKYIFFKIIELLICENKDILKFYKDLHNTHKLYFLLAMFKVYNDEKKYKSELMKISENGLSSNDDFIKGFSLMIYHSITNDLLFIDKKRFIESIILSENTFSKIKLLSLIDFFKLEEELKKVIRDNITSKSNYLQKKFLIFNSSYQNSTLTDELYIKNLLLDGGYMLLPEVAKLFANIRNHTTLFDELISFFREQINLKEITNISLRKFLLSKNENSNISTLNNLKELYKSIQDLEIKRELIDELTRLEGSYSSDDFAKDHKLIDKYNNCYFYKNLGEDNYDFLEIIPLEILKEYFSYNLNEFKEIIEDLAYKKVLPPLEIELDDSKKELNIKYQINENLEKPETKLKDYKNLFVFKIIRDIYKKSNYYHYRLHKIPLISSNNILIDSDKNEAIFISVGRMLCPYYLVNAKTIRNDKRDNIPQIISLFLKEIFFQNNKKLIEDFFKNSKIGYSLFLELFIQKFESDIPYRYSFERVNQIVWRLEEQNSCSDFDITKLYFQEKLDSLIFKNCYQNINWFNICNSVNEFYEAVTEIYEKINFFNIEFNYKNYSKYKNLNLHLLSNYLLNICLNLENIFKNTGGIDRYISLFELMNYYSILCVEIISFFKKGLEKVNINIEVIFKDLEKLKIKSSTWDCSYNDYDYERIKDLLEILKRGSTDYQFLSNFSLKQISVVYLLNFFEIQKNDNLLIIHNAKLKINYFDKLTNVILNILPKIEIEMNSIIKIITEYFHTINIYNIEDYKFKIKEEMFNVTNEINNIRKRTKINRYFGVIQEGNIFPPDIYLKRILGFKKKTDISKIFNIPLNNNWPSYKAKCSWDISRKEIFNLVVPNLRVVNLINKLLITKKFWYRILLISNNRFRVFLFSIFLVLGGVSTYLANFPYKIMVIIFYSLSTLLYAISASLILPIIPNSRKYLINKINNK